MSMVLVPGLASSRATRWAAATSLPASRISPSSRCDLSSGRPWKNRRNTSLSLRVEVGLDLLIHFLDILCRVELPQEALSAVEFDQGVRGLVVEGQPFADGLGGVVAPLLLRPPTV